MLNIFKKILGSSQKETVPTTRWDIQFTTVGMMGNKVDLLEVFSKEAKTPQEAVALLLNDPDLRLMLKTHYKTKDDGSYIAKYLWRETEDV